EPLPQLRRALAHRQRTELRERVDQFDILLRDALAGPLADLASRRTVAAAWKTFQRHLASHVHAEAELLQGKCAWSARGTSARARRQRELEQRIREHQH